MRLALFDLDNTLLAGDSDYEWGQFLIDHGVLDRTDRAGQGRGALGRVMLGSVAAGLLRKARSPVLVIPRGAPDGFGYLQAPPAEAA